MKNKRNIISLIITIIFGVIAYLIILPPINLTSIEFYSFILLLLGVYLVLTTTSKITKKGIDFNFKKSKYLIIAMLLIPGLILVINFILSPVFSAKAFSQRITIVEDTEDSNFLTEIEEVDFSSIPLLDKDSSTRLGDRTMGQMPELVSQFYVSNNYTQINYNNEIVRVTPLEYNGIFKYIANYKEGVKGYITVNSVDGTSNLIKLDKGMKYMSSAYLFKNLDRHLRLKYPTKIFGETNFEIDNEGNPYWITQVVKYVGIGQRKDIEGVIITDPITGKTIYHKVEDVPSWVDHVYDASLIIEQVDNWGTYKEGFLNSLFGQKNVVNTTEGYNYLIMHDDVYLYTGITSVSSDESNLGFILTNLRTKETRFYQVPGAEEYSAMASAEGLVQQMRYTSTFPLLINLNNRPTYLVSLKDNAGLVKMYGFVDVEDYQKVVVTDASKGIESAANNYLNNTSFTSSAEIDKTITIKDITTAIIEGNTYYYITDTENKKYYVSINVDKKNLPFIKNGDSLNIKINRETDVTEIISID